MSDVVPALPQSRRILYGYFTLSGLYTLSAALIWGVNTLFLLDAGLSNAEAFAANAFFSLGQVIFEVPTGVVADTRGRRFSFLLGAATLLISTLLYLYMWNIHAPFWGWAIASRSGIGSATPPCVAREWTSPSWPRTS